MLTPVAHPCHRLRSYVDIMKNSTNYKKKAEETEKSYKIF